ncbi:AMIN domain-containing protein [Polyangium aurulentum]|uniref:AMIN domain-containing protein n=1 Tax=Polyangium aurulentum TaxID=2567896 RepID=UPI0010AEB660|nr:AMIN domain-containing protein [Polyangium aurulentum]UQA55115.1 hypothetical protein E8A73_027620 [Polyangium aurulentum]
MRPHLPAALAALLAAPLAHADEPVAKAKPAAAAQASAQKKAAPKAKKKARKAKREINGPVATFPGFRILEDGSTRVYVEISDRVPVAEHKAEGRIAYRIQGAAVPTRNNLRALDTQFFDTPVARVQLVEDEEDVDLVIELKQPAQPSHRLVDSEGGVVLQVDFPARAGSTAKSKSAQPGGAR